jgi:hypothetical protein
MLVEVGFDLRGGPAVDTEQLVISAYNYALGSERSVLQEDAGLLVVRPVEGRVGVAVAGLFFHGAFQNETV